MPRAKSYDPGEALDAAVGAFWRAGYRGTSVADLEEATGVNRFGLSTHFGGKPSLYVQCLDRYVAGVEATAWGPLKAGGLAGVRTFLAASVDPAAQPAAAAYGCLMVNALAEGTGDFAGPAAAAVRARLTGYVARLESLLAAALAAALLRGEVSAGFDAAGRAAQLTAFVLGAQARNRLFGDVAASAPAVRAALADLDAWAAEPPDTAPGPRPDRRE